MFVGDDCVDERMFEILGFVVYMEVNCSCKLFEN